MSRSLRRCLSLSVAAIVIVSLGACASDATTAPTTESVQSTSNVKPCETQGSDNMC